MNSTKTEGLVFHSERTYSHSDTDNILPQALIFLDKLVFYLQKI
jgi:hypothetical protein